MKTGQRKEVGQCQGNRSSARKQADERPNEINGRRGAGSAIAAAPARLQHDLVQVGVEVRNPFANSNNINHLATNIIQQLGPGKRRVSTERDFVMPIRGRSVRMMYWGIEPA
jgi:hypothetical protein